MRGHHLMAHQEHGGRAHEYTPYGSEAVRTQIETARNTPECCHFQSVTWQYSELTARLP